MIFEDRIRLAIACPDLAALNPVEGAGEVFEQDGERVQRLQFGGLVTADTYYGAWMTELISKCRGAHEPQEERVFAAVLDALSPKPTMIELGGYWCFYSIWLGLQRPGASQVIIEPIAERRAVGERNLALNNLAMPIRRAAIGAAPSMLPEFKTGAEIEKDMPVVTVDQLADEMGWDSVDLLHADVQGFEWQMMHGAQRRLASGDIRWVFISTHRWLEDGAKIDLHETCRAKLLEYGYTIVADHTPEESYSTDGLIVARAPGVEGLEHVGISRRAGDAS
tara:strand:+ start:10708 stop:11544 length:837 start_codon:yes stop_codon:yes gene_type:complete